MIFAMVVIGGVTRLTQSGLSMVEWKPLLGIMPPIGDGEWRELFGQYQRYPEYWVLNYGMTLDDFKIIFWFEYTHRLWGQESRRSLQTWRHSLNTENICEISITTKL